MTTRRPDKPRAPTADEIAEALTAAACAASAVLGPYPKLPLPGAYGRLRQAFHSLGDSDRRNSLAAILAEESGRIDHDQGANFGQRVPRKTHEARPGAMTTQARQKGVTLKGEPLPVAEVGE